MRDTGFQRRDGDPDRGGQGQTVTGYPGGPERSGGIGSRGLDTVGRDVRQQRNARAPYDHIHVIQWSTSRKRLSTSCSGDRNDGAAGCRHGRGDGFVVGERGRGPSSRSRFLRRQVGREGVHGGDEDRVLGGGGADPDVDVGQASAGDASA
ncbi:hypothetical protein [Micromonospora sp. NPDC050276]|uniref:hypothetical protein n=1 Tax=Micromonospora sp. NPDC050276 TaxID=3364278 RepID=UPI00379FACD5